MTTQIFKVAIVIVTWNKKAFVLELLESLKNLNYFNYDVIVIDNCSTDQTAAAIREQFPGTIVIEKTENSGGAGGFNIGLQFAWDNHYPYCWLLDNDVIVDKDALTHLVNTLNSHPNATICGSQILIADSDIIQECGGMIDWRHGNVILNQHGKPRGPAPSNTSIKSVDYCAACSMLVRVCDIELVGKIDPDMFIFWDDIEWSTRIKSIGKSVLCNADSIVWHHFNGYKPSNTWRVYYRIRNKLHFFNLYSENKHLLPKLIVLYEELSGLYKYLGISDFAYAVDSAISDYKAGVRGKWPTQSGTSEFNTHLDPVIPANSYFIVYSHESVKLKLPSFNTDSTHVVIDKNPTVYAMAWYLLKALFTPSVAIGNQLNLFMVFSSFIILMTDSGNRVIKNNKIKNFIYFSYRSGLFSRVFFK